MSPDRVRATAGLFLGLALAACQGVDLTPNDEPPTPEDRARFVRRRIEDAQAFRVQKRLGPAETQLRMALGSDPENARAHYLLARTLHEQGRTDEAEVHAARADAISPPPSEPPPTALSKDASGLLFVLVPPDEERHGAVGGPGEWSSPRVPRQLAKRVRVRLPKAGVTETSPASLREAEEWLRSEAPRAVVSLRVEQASCGDSAKDGPFSIVALTVVSAVSGALPDEPVRVRSVDDRPAAGDACTDAAIARALDEALALPGVARAIAAPRTPADGRWSALAVRALLPIVDVERAREVARARREAGEYGVPLDENATVMAAEADRASERGRVSPGAATDPETEALEAEIASERARRDALLAAIRVDELAVRAPTADEISVLRHIEAGEPQSLGARVARARAGGRPVEIRVLEAPDGRVLARFYFEPGAAAPLLREEDTNLDGVADRFTAYADGRPSEVLEDRGASGHVNARIRLAPDGLSTEIIEIDMDGDERPERVFRYAGGALVSGESDQNGDGTLDRREVFESGGGVASREDDLDGDGAYDVRNEFHDGRLQRREILNPALVEALSRPP